MCLYPRTIKNKKFVPNKSNGGIIPDLPKILIDGKIVDDERFLFVAVDCGRCMECKKKKANNWRVRLMEEIKYNKNGHFVTFTFSNEAIQFLYEKYFKNSLIDSYELDNALAKKAVRLFLERWRKENKVSVKHWLITELGHNGTENIHLHGLIFTDKPAEYIRKKWKYGYIWDSTEHDGYVNEKTINYIIKYCLKIDEKHKNYKPVILSSAGIGKNYIDNNNFIYEGRKTKMFYRMPNGSKVALPKYYKDKVLNDQQRNKLWKYILDKNVNFLNGATYNMDREIDIKNYYNMLNKYREINKEQGYGSNIKDNESIMYEREKRRKNFKKRLK